MAGTFITALVIETNNEVLINPATGVIGAMVLIPTPGNGGVVDADYLAEAVSEGYIGGFTYVVVSPSFSPMPNLNAFHVVRISSTQTSDWWYVVGASYQYLSAAAAAECCTTATNPLPTVIPPLYPCQLLCFLNLTGSYQGVFGIPLLTAGQNYYAAGFYNNVALAATAAGGYSTAAALITALNTLWGTATSGVWSDFGSPLSLIFTQNTGATGAGSNIMCIAITAH